MKERIHCPECDVYLTVGNYYCHLMSASHKNSCPSSYNEKFISEL